MIYKFFTKYFLVIIPAILLGLTILISAVVLISAYQAKKSKVDIFLEGNLIKMVFDLTESDKKTAIGLSNKLGISADWISGLSFRLEDQSLGRVAKVLPLSSEIVVTDKVIRLLNGYKLLTSGSSKAVTTFATGEGRLNLKYGSDQNFDLEVINPEELVAYATQSGQVSGLSELQSLLFLLSSKMSKIDLSIEGKNLSGELIFK